MEWYTVIPTCNRPKELGDLIDTLITNQVGGKERVLVINNGEPLGLYIWDRATVIYDPDQEPHIYQMWNLGLEWAERMSTRDNGTVRPHAVAILNDDVRLPPDFAAKMTAALRESTATIAFPNQFGASADRVNTSPGATLLHRRVTGYAFVVNGTHGIRCDENFKWWYGDDDLDWRARCEYRGTHLVQGVTVDHLYPSQSTNRSHKLTAQAELDRATFIRKHGRAPW